MSPDPAEPARPDPDRADAGRPDPGPPADGEQAPPDPAGAAAQEAAAPKKSDQARDEIRSNAQNPRQAAAANRNLRDARAVFSSGGTLFDADVTVGGDVISGDQYIYQVAGANRTVATYLIDPASTGAFAEGPGYTEFISLFTTRRLILLQAPRGHGKAAAARYALSRAGYADLRRYDPSVTVDDVVHSLRPKTGYLVEEMTDASTRQLTVRALEDLESKLETAQAHLVITIGDSVTFIDPGVHGFVQPMGAPASHGDVYRAHVRHRLSADKAAAVLVLAELESLFVEEVPESAARSKAAEFARHVVDLSRRGNVDPDLLRTRMRREVKREVDSWFADLPNTQMRCLAIALSLLDGLPYQTVVAAADALRARLEPPPPRDSITAPPPPDRFADSRSRRMSRLRADLSAEVVDSRFGELPAQLVRYRDPAYPAEVLSLVWREYDDVRDDFQNWLRDMGDHPSEIVRIRVATAVGLLSLEAFDQLHRTVLQPWVTSDSMHKREMAAYALREPGTRDDLADQVLSLVDEWSADSSWRAREVAARAYGAALGSATPSRALERLGVLAATEDVSVAVAVGKSVAEIIEADQALTAPVLESVLDWIAGDELTRKLTGQLTFLTLAVDLIEEDPDDGADWPLLLRLADGDLEVRRLLARGWRETLLGRPLQEAAASVLSLWAGLAERNSSVRSAFVTLLATTAAGHPRATRTVHYLARGWKSGRDADPAERTATAVLDALT